MSILYKVIAWPFERLGYTVTFFHNHMGIKRGIVIVKPMKGAKDELQRKMRTL